MIIGVKSDKGIIRDINEDSYSIINDAEGKPVSFIIADGMGGHNSGEIASKMAVDYVSQCIKRDYEKIDTKEKIIDYIIKIMQESNRLVYKNSMENEENFGMGTTLIIAVVFKNLLIIGHVGDSRVYLLRDNKMNRITTDHSFVEELIKNGTVSREEASNHPKKNIITRAIGCAEEIQIDIYECEIMDNDIFIICTDGLTNMLSDDEIKNIIQSNSDLEEACNQLVKTANDNGGEDNITVILSKNSKHSEV